jgi:hypothetical protein
MEKLVAGILCTTIVFLNKDMEKLVAGILCTAIVGLNEVCVRLPSRIYRWKIRHQGTKV